MAAVLVRVTLEREHGRNAGHEGDDEMHHDHDLAGESDRQPDQLPRRSWLRARPSSTTPPVLVHWVDEKGSVVRLMSSKADTTGTQAPPW